MNAAISWLDHWQTLVSGALAIVAAGLGAWMLHRQIAQADKHEISRLRSRFVAARAVLPLTLDEVVGYAAAMISDLSNLLGIHNYVGDGPLPASFAPPRFSLELILSLKEAIEATHQPNVIALLSDIIREMQVLSARVSGLSDERQMARAVAINLRLEEFIITAARLHSMASALFAFSRRESETGPIQVNWESAVTALEISNVRADRFPGVYQIIERRLNQPAPLWLYEN